MRKLFKYSGVVVATIICTLLIQILAIRYFLNITPAQTADIGRLIMAYQIINSRFVDKVNSSELADAGIAGMMKSLNDPHSTYLDQDLYSRLLEQTSGSFAGIGVVVGQDKDHKTIVIGVMKDTPGEKAGLKPGDQIIKVDDNDVTGLSLEKVTAQIRGPVDTKVKLSILREGKTINVDITRANIQLKTVEYKVLDNNLGYIHIASFSENTPKEFNEALVALQKDQVKGLIIDLRNNPGGLLNSVVSIAQHLIPKGPIVSIVDRDGHKEVYNSDLAKAPLPMVVLVNGNSASASEILAGAIQDTHTGKIIGEQSYGKGSVQTVMPLFENDGLKITIAKYYTPSGRSIDKVGIKPDVEVKLNSYEPDNQIAKAIEVLRSEIKK